MDDTLFMRYYLLTPLCTVLLEKLTDLQLVKKFPAFHGTRRFITALTSVRHLSLSWASPIQSIYPSPTSCRSLLILFTHLRLGFPSGLFPSGFPSKTLYTPLSSPIRATCPGLCALLYKTLPAQTERDHKIFKLHKVVKMEASSQSEPPSKVPNNHSQESNGRK